MNKSATLVRLSFQFCTYSTHTRLAIEDVDFMIDLSAFPLVVRLAINEDYADVKALIQLTQVFVKEFKKKQKGHIINIGSIAGREPYAGGGLLRRWSSGRIHLGLGIYCATKAAVRSFTGSVLVSFPGSVSSS
jgi:NAD(P)-dependent dehydrogenase (short-subunit alcohol dehydrogenase family)